MGPHLQRGIVVRFYLDAFKGARGLITWQTLSIFLSIFSIFSTLFIASSFTFARSFATTRCWINLSKHSSYVFVQIFIHWFDHLLLNKFKLRRHSKNEIFKCFFFSDSIFRCDVSVFRFDWFFFWSYNIWVLNMQKRINVDCWNCLFESSMRMNVFKKQIFRKLKKTFLNNVSTKLSWSSVITN